MVHGPYYPYEIFIYIYIYTIYGGYMILMIFVLAHSNDSRGYFNPSAMTIQKWVRRRLESGSVKKREGEENV